VLSFPVDAVQRVAGSRRMLGDVVLSLDTARRRAAEERRSLKEELALYLAHGVLHLVGHDHHLPAEARRMASEERRLLGGAGLLDRSGVGRLTPGPSGSEPRRRAAAPRGRRRA
jgi:probable rRNA maturation factor